MAALRPPQPGAGASAPTPTQPHKGWAPIQHALLHLSPSHPLSLLRSLQLKPSSPANRSPTCCRQKWKPKPPDSQAQNHPVFSFWKENWSQCPAAALQSHRQRCAPRCRLPSTREQLEGVRSRVWPGSESKTHLNSRGPHPPAALLLRPPRPLGYVQSQPHLQISKSVPIPTEPADQAQWGAPSSLSLSLWVTDLLGGWGAAAPVSAGPPSNSRPGAPQRETRTCSLHSDHKTTSHGRTTV